MRYDDEEEEGYVKRLYFKKTRYPLLTFYELLHEVDDLMKHVSSWRPFYDYSRQEKAQYYTRTFVGRFTHRHRNKVKRK